MEPAEHLFRHEAGRLVAALTRVFGVHNLALAEDVVQDALCRALEVWKFRGTPADPSAWLLATAKRRNRLCPEGYVCIPQAGCCDSSPCPPVPLPTCCLLPNCPES